MISSFFLPRRSSSLSSSSLSSKVNNNNKNDANNNSSNPSDDPSEAASSVPSAESSSLPSFNSKFWTKSPCSPCAEPNSVLSIDRSGGSSYIPITEHTPQISSQVFRRVLHLVLIRMKYQVLSLNLNWVRSAMQRLDVLVVVLVLNRVLTIAQIGAKSRTKLTTICWIMSCSWWYSDLHSSHPNLELSPSSLN